MTIPHNDKWKRNVTVTLFQYVMQTYDKVIVSYFCTYSERTSKQRVSNVIKNTSFRNLEKQSCHIIQITSQSQTKKQRFYNVKLIRNINVS